MSAVKRTYLISYHFGGGFGRFQHQRTTDDAPTMEQIESMETQLSEKHNTPSITILSVSLIGNSTHG